VTRKRIEHPNLVVRRSRIHGRGLFARSALRRGQLLDSCPVVVVHDAGDELGNYVFDWGRDRLGLALGLVSIANHSDTPNAHVLTGGDELELRALRAIAAGEEILIDYGPDHPVGQL
jgi:SET domain-containing protein